RTQLLFDGLSSFADRDRKIQNAASTIHLQTFQWLDDATGKALADELSTKARAGVKVRIIFDPIASAPENSPMFERMRAGGVEIRAYTGVNMRWHEKHLIVDGKVAIEGSINIGDAYAFGRTDRRSRPGTEDEKVDVVQPKEAFLDVDILLEGPI